MSVSAEIASVIAGIQERQPQMRALFAVDIPENGLVTFSIAPIAIGTPEQTERLHAALRQVADAVRDIVNPRPPMSKDDEARETLERG